MKRVKFLLVLTLGCLSLIGCVPGIQPMIDDYNAMFDIISVETLVDMDRSNWLRDFYEVPSENTLNLGYPYPNSSCTWKLEADPGFSDPQNKLPDGFDIAKHGGNTSYLKVDLKAAGFVGNTYYILTCTVEVDGKTFVDRCKLVIVNKT